MHIYQSSYAEAEKGVEKTQVGFLPIEKNQSRCVEGHKFSFSRHEFKP